MIQHEFQYTLLGNYISNPDLFDECKHLLRPQIWTEGTLRDSYKIISTWHQKALPIDGAILHKQLLNIGYENKQSIQCVSKLNTFHIDSGLIKQYIETLFKDYATEFLKSELSTVILNITEKDIIDSLVKVKDIITTIEMVWNNVSKDRSILEVFDEAYAEILELKEGKVIPIMFSWGIKELDQKTGGVNDGPNIVAATPGSGKTSAIIGMAVENCLKKGYPFLFFSLEMKAKDLMKNIIANITEINSRSIREGNIDDEQLTSIRNVRQRLTDLFQIDETDGITWQQVETKVRAFRKKHKIPLSQKLLVAIDFIQKMRNSPDENRSMSKEERMETIANELARIAKHENLSLVEISQFSREASRRDNPRPKITDLKGSAALEQNAVLAILLYRPDQHGIFTNKDNGMDLRGLCEFNIAKGRFVNPEPVYARFEGKYSKFRDYVPDGGISSGPPSDSF